MEIASQIFDHVSEDGFSNLHRMLANGSDVDEKKDDEPDLWFVGVIIYSLGAFSMALGVVLQKYSINREFLRHKDIKMHRPKPRQPFWVLGIILYGASGGLLSAALGFAPVSLLTPLMSIVIISNALLARFLLSEPLTKRDFYAVCVIVVAVITTTLCAPSQEEKPSTERLIELYQEPLFIVFLVFLLSLLVFFWRANVVIGKKMENHDLLTDKEEFLYPFSFGASAGCWGGLTVTMMKSAITLIQDKFTNEGFGAIFTEGLMYGLISILVVCWYMQLRWINLGLERYPAVFIVSIEAVLNEIVGVSGGLLYFQEFQGFNPGTAVGFTFGLGLGCAGIIVFALRDNTIGPEEDFFSQRGCCVIPLDEDGNLRRGSIYKKGSIKSVASGNDIIFVDENGKEVSRLSGDEEFFEQVDSPLSLIVDGTLASLRFLGSALFDVINPEENKEDGEVVAYEDNSDDGI